MTDATNLPDPVRDASTMIKFIYRELDHAEQPLSVAELEQRTGLSTRGIRAATQELQEADLVTARFETTTPQRKIFETRG
jgi:DNA-binding transcriptional regulator GbsR (MarR family)